jgi:hypothetical protein
VSKTDLIIKNINEVYVQIDCSDSVSYELRDAFTFMVPGAQFSPQFRAKLWDGKIRLWDVRKRLIYRGLIQQIITFANDRNYAYTYDDVYDTEFSLSDAKQFIQSINLTKEPRDYQIDAFIHAIRTKRTLLLSPTASGKSLIIYLILRYLHDKLNHRKTLIIVPTTSLVSQLYKDFEDYGFDSSSYVHKIYSGQEKDTEKSIVISTWQSLYKMPRKYFEQFDSVFGDECLHPDTLITMGDGTKKKICEIVIGDVVKTYNEQSKSIENKKVVNVHENISIQEDFYLVQTECGNEIKITGNHKVLLTSGVWKQVKDLEIGEIINSIE